MTYGSAVTKLTALYQGYFANIGAPTWAARKLAPPTSAIHPSIPFIGKKYFEQPVKILMYASAENLNNYDGRIDNDERAINRHRIYFNESDTSGDIFPNVHIQPVNNGALVMCAYHIMSKLCSTEDESPADFLERIAVANYGKFTIDARDRGINKDYATDPDKLKASQPYVNADIDILQPDLIIMVRSMYDGPGAQKLFVDHIKGHAKVLPIYQITPTTINAPKMFRRFPPVKKEDLSPTLQRWYRGFDAGAISGPYFLSVFPYLDDVLKKVLMI